MILEMIFLESIGLSYYMLLYEYVISNHWNKSKSVINVFACKVTPISLL